MDLIWQAVRVTSLPFGFRVEVVAATSDDEKVFEEFIAAELQQTFKDGSFLRCSLAAPEGRHRNLAMFFSYELSVSGAAFRRVVEGAVQAALDRTERANVAAQGLHESLVDTSGA